MHCGPQSGFCCGIFPASPRAKADNFFIFQNLFSVTFTISICRWPWE
uniref:Uncharacterized protein n=1 Tax=Rhizophora mucronata TaxID=61149 RepID=A0A2P2PUX7_RHIMU